MSFRPALIWAGCQTGVRFATSFLSIKVAATFVGPEGVALIGQMANFMVLMQGTIGNALATGVTKLTAERPDDRHYHRQLWTTAIGLAVLISVPVVLLGAALAEPLTRWLLKDLQSPWILAATVVMLVPAILGTVLTGILNGLKRVGDLGKANIVTALLGTLVSVPLTVYHGVAGGLIGTGAAGVALFVATAHRLHRCGIRWRGRLKKGWNPDAVRQILRFYPMLLAHSGAQNVSLLLVRDAIATHAGLPAAGHWQGLSRISDMYTGVLTAALGMHLTSHLAGVTDRNKLRRELVVTCSTVAGITLVAAVVIYCLRDLAIAIVFTPAFAPMRELFDYQLTGDVFKMISWPLRTALVVTMRSHWYISLELAVPSAQVALTYFLLPGMGVKAATAAYALSYASADLLLLVAWRGLFISRGAKP